MNNKEVLGILGSGFFLGASIGGAIALHSEDVASQNAIVAEACLTTYGNNNGTISQDVVNCMENGWIPLYNVVNVNSAANGEIQKGDPDGLLTGYVTLERYEGTHLETTVPLVWGVVVSVGGFVAIAAMEESDKERRRARQLEETRKSDGTDDPVKPDNDDDDRQGPHLT